MNQKLDGFVIMHTTVRRPLMMMLARAMTYNSQAKTHSHQGKASGITNVSWAGQTLAEQVFQTVNISLHGKIDRLGIIRYSSGCGQLELGSSTW